MFKSLRDRFFRAKKKASDKMESDLSLDYEKFSPEDIETGSIIKESHLESLFWDLELAMLESDVSLETIELIRENLKERLVGLRVSSKKEIASTIETALKASLIEILSKKSFDQKLFLNAEKKPLVIVFVGVNGTGKTTTIARLAHWFQCKDKSVVLAAADTFRAGAIEQLRAHSENLKCKLIAHEQGGDPAAVAFDAIQHAKSKGLDIVLVDTAGRMQTNTNLMDEMKKIKRVANPDFFAFVGDSLAGNDAVEQARKFNDSVGIDIVILTKLDVDAKGGAALSISSTINKPIAFVGIGQNYEDLMSFDSAWVVERIFAQ